MRAYRHDERGQALVEFSLVLIPFMLLLLGLLDVGRGIYTYNAASQAAREIARETAVHPCPTRAMCANLGTSASATATKNQQKSLVPGLTDAGIDIDCVTIQNEVIDDIDCRPNRFIRTTVNVPFQPVTPLLGQLGPFTFTAVARIEMTNVAN